MRLKRNRPDKLESISYAEARDLASAAGFSGESLLTIMQIAMCESNLYTNSRGDFLGVYTHGVLQLENWHFDTPANDFIEGFKRSKGGTDFSIWYSYRNNLHTLFLPDVRIGEILYDSRARFLFEARVHLLFALEMRCLQLLVE